MAIRKQKFRGKTGKFPPLPPPFPKKWGGNKNRERGRVMLRREEEEEDEEDLFVFNDTTEGPRES